MRALPWFGSLALVGVLAAGCSDAATPPTALDADALTPAGSHGPAAHAAATRNFVAPLSGGEEVPAVATEARGLARFQLSRSGDEIEYRLIVANIENVLMSHIHLAPAGQNGGVVVWLYPEGPPPQLIEGRSDGVLATGTITADQLVGALAGEDLGALLEVMEAGGAYVNVHTSQFPGGEVRGQIRAGGPGS